MLGCDRCAMTLSRGSIDRRPCRFTENFRKRVNYRDVAEEEGAFVSTDECTVAVDVYG